MCDVKTQQTLTLKRDLIYPTYACLITLLVSRDTTVTGKLGHSLKRAQIPTG